MFFKAQFVAFVLCTASLAQGTPVSSEATPSEVYGTPSLSEVYGTPTPSEIYESATLAEIYESATPSETYESATPSEIYESATPSEVYESATPSQVYESATLSSVIPTAHPTYSPPACHSGLSIVLNLTLNLPPAATSVPYPTVTCNVVNAITELSNKNPALFCEGSIAETNTRSIRIGLYSLDLMRKLERASNSGVCLTAGGTFKSSWYFLESGLDTAAFRTTGTWRSGVPRSTAGQPPCTSRSFSTSGLVQVFFLRRKACPHEGLGTPRTNGYRASKSARLIRCKPLTSWKYFLDFRQYGLLLIEGEGVATGFKTHGARSLKVNIYEGNTRYKCVIELDRHSTGLVAASTVASNLSGHVWYLTTPEVSSAINCNPWDAASYRRNQRAKQAEERLYPNTKASKTWEVVLGESFSSQWIKI
ncbi:hypothetical protein BKA70DRAFT_1221485 [Coprinopsis sp. MPI-PUGE-AT-0042]|nr:hypothetical protein BKA70DRAFT_1221485 [Coprinopsis sp. MPI-PUGE-AT-0042]